MLVRLTKKAAQKLGVEVKDASLTSKRESYGNIVVVERRHFFLFTHADTLFSCWALAARVKSDVVSPLLRIACEHVRRRQRIARSEGSTA